MAPVAECDQLPIKPQISGGVHSSISALSGTSRSSKGTRPSKRHLRKGEESKQRLHGTPSRTKDKDWEPHCRPYHPMSPYTQMSGYVGTMTGVEETGLSALKGEIRRTGLQLDIAKHPLVAEDSFLLRFLRARKFNALQAYEMIRSDIEWREKEEVAQLRFQKPSDILGCDPSIVTQYLPHWQSGFDKVGRPVIYKHFGATQTWSLKEHMTLENLVKFYWWEQEQAANLLVRRSLETGYECDTFTVIVDLEGLGIRQITKDFLWLVKAISEYDSNHNPERMGQTFMINCGPSFGFIWSGIKPWLDVGTQAKIQILATRKQWLPVLLEQIDTDQLPQEYGGTGPCLSTVDHDAEEQFDHLCFCLKHVEGYLREEGEEDADTKSSESSKSSRSASRSFPDQGAQPPLVKTISF